MGIGPVTFLNPLLLLGLLSLPLIWWLMRVMPPAPKQQVFPPLRILRDVETEEETPDKTPLWLLVARMVMIALLCLGLAKPVLDAPDAQSGDNLTLIIDDSWAGAAVWNDIVGEARAILNTARRENEQVRLVTTVAENPNEDYGPAQAALEELDRLKPQPFAPRYPVELTGNVTYLSGGIGEDAPRGVRVFAPNPTERALAIGTPEEIGEGFRVPVHRAGERGTVSYEIRALSGNGRVLDNAEARFLDGGARTDALFELPAELRNRVSRIEVAGVRSAAAVRLLDDRWGRPVIGVLNVGQDTGSPLLSEPFYARTALAPHADIYDGDLDRLLTLSPSIIVMADSARTDDPRLKDWIEAGGLLLRFGGERLAERPDELVPVRLRIGDRALGGALTWEEPQTLAAFATSSPFSGLPIPEDIRVTRQVMAEPGAETDARTWARLEDGAPIVTTAAEGQGRIVLFHVTAGPEWSNLAISGLYVDMLKRLLPLGKLQNLPADVGETSAEFSPERMLDGFGQLNAPGLNVRPIAPDLEVASESAPPGLYRQGTRRKALNTVDEPIALSAIEGALPYGRTSDQRLAGLVLSAAAFLLALDVLFTMFATGRKPRLPRRTRALAAVLIAGLVMLPLVAQAQNEEPPEAALELYLAYIETGDSRLDQLSEQALTGMQGFLTERTTVHPAGVTGVVPGVDVLDYYPFLFFPVRRDSAALDIEARDALNAYMAAGGTILFDTADFGDSGVTLSVNPGLARVTEGLDMPKIVPVPEAHVLNKTFYILDTYPGRWANGEVWVEADGSGRANDGVSSVIIGSNDWAAGWAVDSDGDPIMSLENDISRQREMSKRFAVNIGMYALAGNYKADQVHTARLVERLGDEFPGGMPLEPDEEPEE